MEHTNTHNIICPYCGYEDLDSWEIDEDETTTFCCSCEKEFNFFREIEVTYTTSKIECMPEKHDYNTESYHIKKREYLGNNVCLDFPEDDWLYYKIEVCKICDYKNPVRITKENYEANKDLVLD